MIHRFRILRNHAERRRIQTRLPIYPVGRDDWRKTVTDAAVADVLRAIHEHHGTSPTFEVRESDSQRQPRHNA